MGSCSQVEGEGSPFGKDYLYEMQESVTIQTPWVSRQLLESVLLILKSRLLNPAEEAGASFSYVCYSPVADLALSRPSPLLLSSQLFFTENDFNFFLQKCKECLFGRSSLLLQFFYWSWFHCVKNDAYNAIFWYWKTPLLWILSSIEHLVYFEIA